MNVTLKYHILKYENEDQDFVQKLLQSLYVDDIIAGDEINKDFVFAAMLLLWCHRAGVVDKSTRRLDASVSAYAAVAYLRIETAEETYLKS